MLSITFRTKHVFVKILKSLCNQSGVPIHQPFRGCLYETRDGIKTRRDDFCPPFICKYFPNGTGWDVFCTAFLSVESSRWFQNYSCWWILWKKLPNSILKFNSSFWLFPINLAVLWNQKHNCFWTKFLIQVAKQNFSSRTFLLSCWECSNYIVVMFTGPSNNHTRSFLVTFLVCCCEFRYFNFFVTFGRIFFPPNLVGCFLGMLSKQARLLQKH